MWAAVAQPFKSRISPPRLIFLALKLALKSVPAALSVQANRHTPFANRRMKFCVRTITEAVQVMWRV
jgi:hypothetical protein